MHLTVSTSLSIQPILFFIIDEISEIEVEVEVNILLKNSNAKDVDGLAANFLKSFGMPYYASDKSVHQAFCGSQHNILWNSASQPSIPRRRPFVCLWKKQNFCWTKMPE